LRPKHTRSAAITRQKIQELPLNGRSFLQLAFLEPGVTASPGSTSQYNSLFSVSILGGDANKTAITVDGGNIRNNIEGNTGMNFSQEVVEEFQLSSANFDLSTGITSGCGEHRDAHRQQQSPGSGHLLLPQQRHGRYPRYGATRSTRIRILAAESRRVVGGPIARPPVLLRQLRTYRPRKAWSRSSRTWPPPAPSPACSRTLSGSDQRARRLARERQPQRVLRFSHDKNSGFADRAPRRCLQLAAQREPVGADRGWPPIDLHRAAAQRLPVNYTYWRNRNLFADDTTCGDCVGLGFPQININGTNVTVGSTSNATQGRDAASRWWTPSRG
jgi:hypothetical protein